MSARRTESARHNGRRRRKAQWPVFGILFAALLVILAAILVTPFLTNESKNADKPAQSQTTTTTTSSSSKPQQTDKIVWQKQSRPVKLPILVYHGVHTPRADENVESDLVTTPDQFESQMRALSSKGYYAVTPKEAYKILNENVLPQDKKPVWLTFDGSLSDFASTVYPILSKYKMTATNMAVTYYVSNGESGYLSRKQVKDLAKKGISFQSKTAYYSELGNSAADVQNTELTVSADYLKEVTGKAPIAITYPRNSYTDDTITMAKQAGYKLGLTDNEGLASKSNNLLSLNRITALPSDTDSSILEKIATE